MTINYAYYATYINPLIWNYYYNVADRDRAMTSLVRDLRDSTGKNVLILSVMRIHNEPPY